MIRHNPLPPAPRPDIPPEAERARCQKDAGSGNPFKLVLTHCDQLEPTIEADLYSDGKTRAFVGNTRRHRETIVVT